MTNFIVSALFVLISIILVGLLYVYKVDRKLLKIQSQLDKQKAELDRIIRRPINAAKALHNAGIAALDDRVVEIQPCVPAVARRRK